MVPASGLENHGQVFEPLRSQPNNSMVIVVENVRCRIRGILYRKSAESLMKTTPQVS